MVAVKEVCNRACDLSASSSKSGENIKRFTIAGSGSHSGIILRKFTQQNFMMLN
jgi:hypothetical protein